MLAPNETTPDCWKIRWMASERSVRFLAFWTLTAT
jgi:hypothetical protein